jgi:hypothetical protein
VGGKRELAQTNVLDLAVLPLVSNALQNRSAGAGRVLEGVPASCWRTACERIRAAPAYDHKDRARVDRPGSGLFEPRRGGLIVLEPNGPIAVMGEEAAARRRGELSAVGLTDLEADATTA